MKRYGILCAVFAFVSFVAMRLVFSKYELDAMKQFEAYRLDTVVNYATEAAVDELLQFTSDLGTDYVDYDKIKVDPDVALDAFIEVFCSNYNMTLSEENKILIATEYVPMFAVATYDGYYIGSIKKINNSGARDIIFTQKMPYLYTDDKSNTYALNLSLSDAFLYDGSTIRRVKTKLSKQEQSMAINSLVSDDILNRLWEVNNNQDKSTFYLPPAVGKLNKANPITGTTVMAYVNNFRVGGQVVDAFGIGGAKVSHQNFVSCYERDGQKMYCRSTDVQEGVTVIETFETDIQAAKEGYYFDMSTI